MSFLLVKIFVIFSAAPLISTQCMTLSLNNIKIQTCSECSYDYYNENYLSEIHDIENLNCSRRIDRNVSKNILIVPNGKKNEYNSSELSIFSNIYDCLIDAFSEESYEISHYMSITINFYLAYQTHVLEYNSSKSNEFFKSINGKILIAPLYCDFLNISGCLDSSKTVEIYMSDLIFKFFVSYYVEINSIIFNWILAFNDHNSNLYDGNGNLLLACSEKDLKSESNEICFIEGINFQIYQNQLFDSFFIIEGLIDNPNYAEPVLKLINVTFKNCYFSISNSSVFFYGSLIKTNILQGDIILENVLIYDSFLIRGIWVVEEKNNNKILNNMINLAYDIHYNTIQSSIFNLRNISIQYLNQFHFRNIYQLSENFVFQLKNWIGLIIIEGFSINNFKRFSDVDCSLFFWLNLSNLIIHDLKLENIENCIAINSMKSTVNIVNCQISNFSLHDKQLIIVSSSNITMNNSQIFQIKQSLSQNFYYFIDSYILLINIEMKSLEINNNFIKSSVVFIINAFSELLTSNILFEIQESDLTFQNCFFHNMSLLNSFMNAYSSNLISFHQLTIHTLESHSIFIFSAVETIEFSSSFFIDINISFMFPMSNDMAFLNIYNDTFRNFYCESIFYLNNDADVLFKNILIENAIGRSDEIVSILSNSITVINSTLLNITGSENTLAIFDFSSWYAFLYDSFFINNGWKKNYSDFYYDDQNCVVSVWLVIHGIIHNCTFASTNVSHFSMLYIYAAVEYFTFSNNAVKIDKQVPTFFYNGILFLSLPILYFTNNLVLGAECPQVFNKSLKGIYKNGPVTFMGLESGINLTMLNNNFDNCHCLNAGSFSIMNYESIILENISISNSSANNIGGGLLINSNNEIQIKSLFINGVFSKIASCGLITNIRKITFHDFIISNSFSDISGCFKLLDVDYLEFINSTGINLNSIKYGAFLNIYSGFILINNLFLLNTTTFDSGGAFYLNNQAKLFFSKGVIINSTAYDKGGCFFVESANIIEIENFSFSHATANKGSSFYVNSINILKLNHVTIENSIAYLGGIILTESKNEESQHIFINIYCFQNNAPIGSCFFHNSQSFISIYNMVAGENIGSVFVLSSIFPKNAIIENICLQENIFNDVLIKVISFQLNLFNVTLKDNQGKIIKEKISSALFSFEGSNSNNLENIFLENVNFSDQIFEISCFSIYSSHLSIKYFRSNIDNALNIKFFLAIIIENSYFSLEKANISNMSRINSIGILSALDSTINLSYCKIKNNNSTIINIENSNLSLSFCEFTNSDSNILSFANDLNLVITNNFYTQFYFILIQDSNFFVGVDNKNGGISSFFSYYSSLIILNCKFSSLQQTKNKAILIADIPEILINNSLFSYFEGDYGSAINIMSYLIIFCNIHISDSLFFANKALVGGSIYISGFGKIVLENSNFTLNSAFKNSEYSQSGIAAGIFFISYNKSLIFSVSKTYFALNSADFFGPTIVSSNEIMENDSSFYNNIDSVNFTKSLTYFKLNVKISSKSSKVGEFFSFKSGQKFGLLFELIDGFNQTINFDTESFAELKIDIFHQDNKSFNSIFLQKSVVKANKGYFNFNDILIKTYTNRTVFLLFYLEFTHDISGQTTSYNFPFQLFSNFCSIGEIISADKSCLKCPKATYSLKNPNNLHTLQKCFPCSNNAFCPGEFMIIPQYGYWRRFSNSTKIIKCLLNDACVNDLNEKNMTVESTGVICERGHQLNLCFECIRGYGKYSTQVLCEPCNELDASAIIRLIVVSLIIIIYIFNNSRSLMQNKDYDLNGIIVKVVINHLQRITLISIFNFEFNLIDIHEFYGYFSFISILTENLFSNDCFIQKFSDDTNKYYQIKVAISLFLPVLFSLFCLVLFSCSQLIIKYKNRKKNQIMNSSEQPKIVSFWDKVILTLFLALFLFYPLIIKCSFSLLNCISLDDITTDTFLYDSPNFKCWEKDHIVFLIITGIIGILFWGTLFPIYLSYIIKKSKHIKKNYKINTEYNERNTLYKFFYRDYKDRFYYWECILFFQKFFLTFLVNIKEIFGDETRDCLFYAIYFIYLDAMIILFPFKIKQINYLEIISIFVCILNRMLNSIISSYDNAVVYFLYGLSIFLNCFFLIYALILIVKYTKWREIWKKGISLTVNMKNIIKKRRIKWSKK